MSFFHRDPPKDNEDYIKREREHDEKKRKKLLNNKANDNEESKEVSNSGTQDAPKVKRSIKEKFEDYKLRKELEAEEKSLKAHKKRKDRDAKKQEGIKEREKKVYGHELSVEEKGEYLIDKHDVAERKAKSREQFKSKLSSFGKSASSIGGGLGGLGGSSDSFGFGSGPNPLDASKSLGKPGNSMNFGKSMLDITADRSYFEKNFGRAIGGRRPRKVKASKPSLSFNIFD